MPQLFTNNADSELGGAIDTAALSITLKVGGGAKFPSPTGGDFFLATLFQRVGAAEANHEIVKCTARSGDVLTVVRAQESTTAKAFSNADPVELRLTAAAAQSFGIKASLGTNLFTGTQDMGGNYVTGALLSWTREYRGAVAITVAGVLSLDLSYAVMSVALNANITSITLGNNIASGSVVQSIMVEFTADGTQRTVIWPSGNGTTTLLVKFPSGGTAPTLTATSGKRDTIMLKSVSQYLWDAYVVGQNQ